MLKNVALAYEASNSASKNATTSTTAGDRISTSKGSSVAQEDGSGAQNSLLDSVEQDFDKIRESQSYDPATDKWSSIEDFETVEILEDTTQQRPDRYIYYSFWAYDAAKKRWYKVDIRDYGYKYRLGAKNLTSETAQSETAPQEEEDKARARARAKAKAKDRDSGWKNLGLSFSLGGGATLYNNDINNLQLIERDGDYFLQAQDDELKAEACFIRWFRDRYEKRSNFLKQPVSYGSQTIKRVPIGKKFGFQGRGINIPITLALHYTFFKRLRMGAGSNLEINYLKKLATTGDASHIRDLALQEPWLYNLKWFGLIGFKIVRKPTQAMILDAQIGSVYDAGSRLKMLLKKREYLHSNWYISIGVGYEKKLNNYFKLMTRLSGDYKRYKDTASFPSNGSVTLSQPALHLEVGITFNFAQDTEGNETEAADESTQPGQKLEEAGEVVKKSSDDLDKLERAKNKANQTKNRLERLFR